MTGDKLPAEEAQRIGLIWQCVDDAALMDSAMTLATRLAAMPSKALADTRLALDAASMLDYNQALALRHNGAAGFSSRKPRPEGTIGLDPAEIAQVQAMLDGLSRQIVDTTSNLRAALQRT